MDLHLEVAALRGLPPQAPARLHLSAGSCTLGRNPDNDLHLADPERLVSGRHARIELRDGGVWIYDLSTNGTFLNGASERLPPGQPVALHDGDRLALGPYEVAVHIEAPAGLAADPFAASPSPLPGMAGPGPAPDILDLLGGGGPQTPFGSQRRPPEDPFPDARAMDQALGGPAPVDDSPRAAPPRHTPVEHVYFRPPETQPFPEDYDLLADLPGSGGAAPRSALGSVPGSTPRPAPGPPAQAPGSETPRIPSLDEEELSLDLEVEHEPAPPAGRPAWEDPFAGPFPGLSPEPAFQDPFAVPAPEPAPEPAPIRAEGAPPEDGWARTEPPGPLPGPQVATPLAPESGPVAETGSDPVTGRPAGIPAAPGWGPVREPEPSSAPAPGAAPIPSPAVAPTPASAPVVPASHPAPARSTDDLLAAFLAGMGTGDPDAIADPAAFLKDAGALLRTLTAGLAATMMARARFKSELRLGVTTIRRSENNPFKFSVTPDEALERLLLRPNPAYLPALPAAQGAFEDIQAHEMAMIAGLRAALRALLARFEPSALETRLEAASGLDKVLPMARKSRYWDLFTETYEQVAADAAEDFMQLFGETFTRAYEDQIMRLAQARGGRPG